MSVHVISWVLRNSKEKLGRRLVLLVIADHASGDGTNAWPSIDTIAEESLLSRRQVQECLRRLEESGAIVETGTSEHGTHVYSVTMGGAESAPLGGAVHDIAGVQNRARRGADTAPEPSLEPSKGQPSKDLAPAARSYDPLKGTKIDGRNLPWDVLVEVTQADEVVEKGKIAKALKLIRGYVVDAHSEQAFEHALTGEMLVASQIRARARLYRDRWPNVELTPLALANNWSRVVTEQPGRSLDTALEAAQRGIDSARRSA